MTVLILLEQEIENVTYRPGDVVAFPEETTVDLAAMCGAGLASIGIPEGSVVIQHTDRRPS